jgi:hypothetical protein
MARRDFRGREAVSCARPACDERITWIEMRKKLERAEQWQRKDRSAGHCIALDVAARSDRLGHSAARHLAGVWDAVAAVKPRLHCRFGQARGPICMYRFAQFHHGAMWCDPLALERQLPHDAASILPHPHLAAFRPLRCGE